MAVPTLSIVVPAYQEARRLPRLIEQVRTTARADVAAAGLSLAEVIVVENGSTDGTGALLAEAAEREPLLIALTAPGERRGKGHAVAAGVAIAGGDLVLLADVDLSAPLSEVARLRAALARGADVAIGSRALAGARVEDTPKTREAMGRTFNALVRGVTGLSLRDTQCPLKLLPTAVARRLTAEQLAPGFAFDVELLLRAHRAGLEIAEVPIEFRHDRDSRVRPVASSASMAFDLLRLGIRLRGPARKGEREARRKVGPARDEPGL